jgi:hypothetical protein
MTQATLFDYEPTLAPPPAAVEIPVYRRGHLTQLAAAVAVAPFVRGLREKVFKAICAGYSAGGVTMPGATREEIHEMTGLRLQTVCGRANELLKAGLVTQAGLCRPGKSGVVAKVLIARRADA